jgi:hypothetical protein
MQRGIQFRGESAVMAAFDNMRIQSWCLCYGKNINCKYPSKQSSSPYSFEDSRELLRGVLKTLSEADNGALYTLHLYEDLKGSIKPSTEPDYSYNIVLAEEEERSGRGSSRQYYELMDKFRTIEAKLTAQDELIKEYENSNSEPEKEAGVLGFLNGLVSDDRFKNKLQDAIFGLADKWFAGSPLMNQNSNVVPMGSIPAKVGAISETDPILIDQREHELLQNAIDILVRVDPKLGTNLKKIADVAAKDKQKYLSLISILNSTL